MEHLKVQVDGRLVVLLVPVLQIELYQDAQFNACAHSRAEAFGMKDTTARVRIACFKHVVRACFCV